MPGADAQPRLAALAGLPGALRRDRRPARGTCRSTRAGWSSRRGRSSSSCRSSRRRWRAARSASGTRTPAPTPASSRSTCSGWGCSRPSRSASSRSPSCAGSRSTSRGSRSTTPTSTARSRTRTRSGLFQIESRAQMQSLLRTRPENLDDLTIQVALVRPGPDPGQGGAPVHRAAAAPARGSELRAALRPPAPCASRCATRSARSSSRSRCSRSPWRSPASRVGEAEGLRRAMSRKRSQDAMEAYRRRFVEGALANGVDRRRRELVFDKLVGFAGFGFPKSHAAAFALLAYQSAWLRHHYPAEFLCALLNAQPMGFYPPASLVRDAQRRGVEVLPPDVNRERREVPRSKRGTVRVGLGYIKGLGEEPAAARSSPSGTSAARSGASPTSPGGRRSTGPRWRRSSRAGACDSFGWPRRQLLWRLGLGAALGERRLAAAPSGSSRSRSSPTSEVPELPEQTPWERMLADYRHTSLSVGRPPARAAAAASARERWSRARSWRSASTRSQRRRSPASRSRASDRRPRTASSSCCSRTSTGR